MIFFTDLQIHPLHYRKQVSLKSAFAHKKPSTLCLVKLWNTFKTYRKSVDHRTSVWFCWIAVFKKLVPKQRKKNHKATGNFLKFINYTCKGNQEWTTKLSDKMLNQGLTFPHEKPLQLIYFAENWGTQTWILNNQIKINHLYYLTSIQSGEPFCYQGINSDPPHFLLK